MSVQAEITRINSAKTDIINAIIAKGVSVPATSSIDDLAGYINSIQIGVIPSGNVELAKSSGTDVSQFATASVRSSSVAINTPTVSAAGLITASATLTTSGWIGSAPSSKTKQLTVQAAKTVTPTSSSQTAVASGRYTTGAVTVSAVPTESKTITTNGTHSATSGKWWSSVTVSIPEYDGSVT